MKGSQAPSQVMCQVAAGWLPRPHLRHLQVDLLWDLPLQQDRAGAGEQLLGSWLQVPGRLVGAPHDDDAVFACG